MTLEENVRFINTSSCPENKQYTQMARHPCSTSSFRLYDTAQTVRGFSLSTSKLPLLGLQALTITSLQAGICEFHYNVCDRYYSIVQKIMYPENYILSS